LIVKRRNQTAKHTKKKLYDKNNIIFKNKSQKIWAGGYYFGVPYVGVEWVIVMDVKNLNSVILYEK